MRWSGSKLKLLQLCPWSFAEDYIRKVRRPPHPALEGGSSAHAGLAMVVRAAMMGDPIDVLSIARHVCAGGPAELADTVGVLTLLQEELAEDPAPFVASRVIYLEERLEMTIGTHVFDGMSDLVEADAETCIVTDWKTHWRPESQEAFEADVQLPRYALLVDENNPGRFSRFVLRKRFVRYRGAVRERILEPYHLAVTKWDLVAEIEEAELRIQAGTFQATPGDWCTLCSRTSDCPVVRAFLESETGGFELAGLDDERAAAAAATMRAIDAHSATIKRQLKTYLGNDHPTGRLPLAGGTYGFGPAKHKRASVDDVLDVYEAHVRPINRHVLRVDVDQLRKSLDREPGNLRRAMTQTIEEYEQADCRYRRGDNQEEESTE